MPRIKPLGNVRILGEKRAPQPERGPDFAEDVA